MLWKFNSVYNAERQYSEHFREARYLMRPPSFHTTDRPPGEALYIHNPRAETTEGTKQVRQMVNSHAHASGPRVSASRSSTE
jgi:hypothetical protein